MSLTAHFLRDEAKRAAPAVSLTILGFAVAALVALPSARNNGGLAYPWIGHTAALIACLTAFPAHFLTVLGATLIGGVAAGLVGGADSAESLALALVGVAQTALAVTLIRGRPAAPFRFRDDRRHYLEIQAVAAIAAPVAGALAAAWIVGGTGRANPILVGLTWWTGEALGALVILPIALLSSREAWRQVLGSWRFLELSGWLIGSGTITYLAVLHSPYPFLAIAVPAALAAFRGPELTAALAGAATAATILVAGLGDLIPATSRFAGAPVQSVCITAAVLGVIPFCIALALGELRRANQRLAASESRWSFALQSAGQGVWDRDIASGKTFFSPVWKSMLGYDAHEVGDSVDDWRGLLHPDDLAIAEAADAACISGRTDQFECEFRMRHKDGGWVWILDRGRVIERTASGIGLRMIGTHTDITKQKAAAERLDRLNQRIQLATKAGNIGVWELNLTTGELWWDGRMHSLFGTDPGLFTANEANWARLFHPSDRQSFATRIRDADCQGGFDGDFRIVWAASGETRFVRVSAARLETESAAGRVLVGTCWDVTQEQVRQQRIAPDPTSDPLTGLPNRKGFERSLALARLDSTGGEHTDAVCVLDLHRFADVNATKGAAIGDTILRKVGGLLRQSVRGHDLVSRIGADEFGLLLRGATVGQANLICGKLIEVIADALPESADGLGANIGIAIMSGGAEPEEVLALAEGACLDAKRRGRGHIRVAARDAPAPAADAA
ncbi:MAG: PAS domain-containing protein [Bauldia sp.]